MRIWNHDRETLMWIKEKLRGKLVFGFLITNIQRDIQRDYYSDNIF